jgi:hypothetical protein
MENYIKMDLRDIGCDDVDWIRLALDSVQWWAFVSTVMTSGFYKKREIY